MVRAREFGRLTEIWKHMVYTRTFPDIQEDGSFLPGKAIRRETVYLAACKALESSVPDKVLESRVVSVNAPEEGTKVLEVRFVLDAVSDDARVSGSEMEMLEGEFRRLGE
ncbi:MAG: hypothetical protein GY820_39520 [Gammaproteobacteria bacterium]|nr:hypothetical protein [Gammaproteobacteria bacterium]